MIFALQEPYLKAVQYDKGSINAASYRWKPVQCLQIPRSMTSTALFTMAS